MNKRWDDYFMGVAQLTSLMSKDPRTKVGAVIVDRNNRIISTGFNGLARGITEESKYLDDRDIKNMMVLHAEQNAIMYAKQDLSGTSIYVTHFPCAHCASFIIQAGISEVIASRGTLTHWDKSTALSKEIFGIASIVYR